MNGFSAEPGERKRLRQIHLPGAVQIEIIGRCDAREDFAARMIDRKDRNRNLRAERAGAFARQHLKRAAADRASMVSSCRSACGADSKRLIGGMRRERRHRLAARDGIASVLALATSSCGNAGIGARCDRARGRARACARSGERSGRRASGDCGSATSKRRFRARQPLRLLAEIGQRGRAHAFEIAAIGRKREIERRGSRPCCSARSSSTARTIWRSFARIVRSVRGSISRATCMVMVEPPDTISRCAQP